MVPERVRRVVAAPRDREEEGRRQVASAWGGIGDWGWQEVQLPGGGGRAREGGGGGRGWCRDLGRSSVPSARASRWQVVPQFSPTAGDDLLGGGGCQATRSQPMEGGRCFLFTSLMVQHGALSYVNANFLPTYLPTQGVWQPRWLCVL